MTYINPVFLKLQLTKKKRVTLSLSDIIRNPFLVNNLVIVSARLDKISTKDKMAVVYGAYGDRAYIRLNDNIIYKLLKAIPHKTIIYIKDIEYKIDDDKFVITNCNIEGE